MLTLKRKSRKAFWGWPEEPNQTKSWSRAWTSERLHILVVVVCDVLLRFCSWRFGFSWSPRLLWEAEVSRLRCMCRDLISNHLQLFGSDLHKSHFIFILLSFCCSGFLKSVTKKKLTGLKVWTQPLLSSAFQKRKPTDSLLNWLSDLHQSLPHLDSQPHVTIWP